MDDRVREHAEILVDWCTGIERGDDVVVDVPGRGHDLALCLAERLGELGANPEFTYRSSELTGAYLRHHDGDFDGPPGHSVAVYENADVVVRILGTRNANETASVPTETRRRYERHREPVSEALFDTDAMYTLHPTRSDAQRAGMSFAEYQEFVYDAVLRDWQAVAEEMARLKDVLDRGSEVRIVTDESDLTMSIRDRTAVNSCSSVEYDSSDLPSGEVYTAPAGTTGTILFDVPMTIHGQPVRNVRLTIEDNEVVAFSADRGEEVVAEILATDEGARHVGELGIGMNRGITRPTGRILLDEKMAGTVHLALGRAYEENVPDGETGNDSAVHVDLIADVTGDSRIVVDGDTIQRNGVFRWEDGFES